MALYVVYSSKGASQDLGFRPLSIMEPAGNHLFPL